MARYEFRMQRLYVTADLGAGAEVEATAGQAHYLRTVLRLDAGRPVLVFNGRDGEWQATIAAPGSRTAAKRGCVLLVGHQTRVQEGGPDLHYLFAPLKKARLDYMVEKATEMGAAVLQPVLTQHTQAERLNHDRMGANVVEAAEQCGILRVPQVRAAVKLEALLTGWDAGRWLIFCDEDADTANPLEALARVSPASGPAPPLAVLIGPEGGFSQAERSRLLVLPFVVRLALGPRILRADTAAVAALALVNAALGDWR